MPTRRTCCCIVAVLAIVLASAVATTSGGGGIRSQSKPNQASEPDRVYDCAANCLYFVGRLLDQALTYERCLELLPADREGNSIAEVKAALASCGMRVQPVWLAPEALADISTPAIVLDLGVATLRSTGESVGHFVVFDPRPDDTIRLLDYPKRPMVGSRQQWRKFAGQAKIKRAPALLVSAGRNSEGE